MTRLRWIYASAMLIMACLLCGCNDSSNPEGASQSHSAKAPPALAKPSSLTLTIWQAQQIQLDHAIAAADALVKANAAFLQQPSETSAQNSLEQWRQLQRSLEPLAICAELSHLQQGPQWRRIEQIIDQLNSWPANAGYLDSGRKTGLVFDIDTPITAASLAAQHQLTHADDASLGLYAMHNLFQASPLSSWQAITVLTDELRNQGFTATQELPPMRRRQLLQAQSEQLLADLKSWRKSWAARGRNSLINAFSQQNTEYQTHSLLTAAQNLAAHHLTQLEYLEFEELKPENLEPSPELITVPEPQTKSELQPKPELRPKPKPTQPVFRTRLILQQQGLANWLGLLEMSAAADTSQVLQGLLAEPSTQPETLQTAAAAVTVEIKQVISKKAPPAMN